MNPRIDRGNGRGRMEWIPATVLLFEDGTPFLFEDGTFFLLE